MTIAYWPIERPTVEARRSARRWAVVAVVLELAGLAGFLVTVAVLALPVWEIVLHAVVAVGFLVGFVYLGLAVLRSRRRGYVAAPLDSPDIDPGALRRVRRNMTIGAVVGFTIGLIFTIILLTLGRPLSTGDLVRAISSPIGFGGYGGAISSQITLLGIGQTASQRLGADYALRRRLVKIVIRGKHLELAPEDHDRAAGYAAVTLTLNPYRLAGTVGIFLGASANLAPLALDDGANTLAVLEGAILLLLLLALSPMAIRQHHNIARYTREHPTASLPHPNPAG